MSCHHKLLSRISALSEKLFCLTGNPIKTLLAILFLIVGWGQIADFRKITSAINSS